LAAREERDVGAESRAVVQQLGARDGGVHQRVHGVEHGPRVARAAAQAGAHGDPFGELDRHAERAAGRFQRRARRAHREVGLGRAEIRAVHRERDAGRRTGDHELVRQFEQRERGLNLVIAPCRTPCRRFAREDA